MNNCKQKSIDIVLLNYGIVKQNTKEIFKTREMHKLACKCSQYVVKLKKKQVAGGALKQFGF